MKKGIMGFIERDGKFLFGVESKPSHIHGKWRLLGGKVEQDETSEQAMLRECVEEAGVQVKLNKFLGHVGIKQRDIAIYLCHTSFVSGEPNPKLNEVGRLEWFSLEEAKQLDKDPVSEFALGLLEESLKEKE